MMDRNKDQNLTEAIREPRDATVVVGLHLGNHRISVTMLGNSDTRLDGAALRPTKTTALDLTTAQRPATRS